MGQHHVFSITEDAIALNIERRPELASSIGEAIISLAYDPPQINASTPDRAMVNWRSVLNCTVAVRKAGDLHSTETQLFVWLPGGLRALQDLSMDELQEVQTMLGNEIASRGG